MRMLDALYRNRQHRSSRQPYPGFDAAWEVRPAFSVVPGNHRAATPGKIGGRVARSAHVYISALISARYTDE